METINNTLRDQLALLIASPIDKPPRNAFSTVLIFLLPGGRNFSINPSSRSY